MSFMLILLLYFQISIVFSIHNDGNGCYNYNTSFSLVGGTGVQTIAPIDPISDSALCTLRTNFTMYMPDCSTPFTNTHPSVVINEAPTFYGFGDFTVDTTSPVQGHAVVTFCIEAVYHGWIGSSTYSPTSYPRVITFRICEDYITMDINKAYYYEKAYAYNSGIQTDSTIMNVAFSGIEEKTYCGLLSYGIYQYNSATSTFVQYAGTDVYWDTNDLEIHYKTTTKGVNTYYIKALTHGDKTIDYEKIKITICGLETLAPTSATKISYTIAYDASSSGYKLPWSTIQSWLTFDANTQSDLTCRNLVKGNMAGINLYTTNSYNNRYTTTTYVKLDLVSGSATDYELTVYNNIQWANVLTIFYGEYTLGAVTSGVELEIKVCGSETLTASAEETYFYLAVDTYNNQAIEWSVYQTYFTFSDGIATCRSQDLTHQWIYTDAALTTLASTSQVELVEEVSGQFRIKVYNQNAWTSVMKYYIKETTLGLISATKIINIQVCGKESWIINSAEYSRQWFLEPAYKEEITEWATITGYFTYNAGTMSSASCRKTDNTHVKLYSDSTCTTVWTNTTKILWAEDVANQFRIKVIRSVTQKQSVWVGETTLGNVLGCKEYTYEVCGTETVSLKDPTSWLSFNATQFTGEHNIKKELFEGYFDVDSTFCLIEKYELVNENKTAFWNREFLMEDDFSITYRTFNLIANQTFYIKAMTGNSTNYAYLPINISVIEQVFTHLHRPPFFDGDIKGGFLILDNDAIEANYTTNETSSQIIGLPTIADSNEDFCSIMFQSPSFGFDSWTNTTDGTALARLDMKKRQTPHEKSFAWLKYENGNLTINFPKDKVREMNGTHEIKISLIDEKANYESYMIYFTVILEQEWVPTYWAPPEEKEKDDFIVKAKIHSMDQYGLVLIVFNVNITTEFVNITEMNTTYIDMFVEPYDDWYYDVDDFNMTHLNFTWNVTSYHGRKLYIQCNFFSPPTISPKSRFDNLVFHIKEKREFYRSLNEGVNIHNNYTTLRHKIPRQAAHDLGGAPEMLTNFIMTLMIIIFFLSFIMGSAGSAMVGMVNGLQLIVHLPIHDIAFPANVMSFLRSFVEATSFDVMPYLFRIWYAIFPNLKVDESLVEEEEEEVLNIWDQTQDLGYDSHIPLELLKTLQYMTLYWMARVVFYFILKKLNEYKKGKFQKLLDDLRDTIFFQEILLILIEGYIEFVIMIFIYNDRVNPMEHPFWSTCTVIMYLGGCCIFIPGAFIYLWTRSLQQIKEDEVFKRRWTALFENKRTNQKPQVLFFFVFVLRRLIYVSTAFLLVGQNYFQIIILNFLNLFVTIYQGFYKPLTSLQVNLLEANNELHIAAATFNVMLFTEWVPDPEVRYFYGWTYIIIMLHQMLWNLFWVLWQFIGCLKLLYVKYYRRFKVYFDKWWKQLRDYCCLPAAVWEVPEVDLDPNTTLHLNFHADQPQQVEQVKEKRAALDKILEDEALARRVQNTQSMPKFQEFSFTANDPAPSIRFKEFDHPNFSPKIAQFAPQNSILDDLDRLNSIKPSQMTINNDWQPTDNFDINFKGIRKSPNFDTSPDLDWNTSQPLKFEDNRPKDLEWNKPASLEWDQPTNFDPNFGIQNDFNQPNYPINDSNFDVQNNFNQPNYQPKYKIDPLSNEPYERQPSFKPRNKYFEAQIFDDYPNQFDRQRNDHRNQEELNTNRFNQNPTFQQEFEEPRGFRPPSSRFNNDGPDEFYKPRFDGATSDRLGLGFNPQRRAQDYGQSPNYGNHVPNFGQGAMSYAQPTYNRQETEDFYSQPKYQSRHETAPQNDDDWDDEN